MSGSSHWCRSFAAALLVAATMAFPSSPAPAQQPPIAVPGEVCSTLGAIPELGGRICAGFEAGSAVLAAVCQQLGLPAATCELVDGTPVDDATIAAYEESWVHRALRLQEHLDRHEPIVNSLIPHTHNSANSTAYGPSLSTYDPNQRYSIGDQLRMDIRGIELDLHLVGGDVVLCHGTTVPVGDLVVHVGCSIDMPLAAGLAEIRDFLARPDNADVVVLLYLENQLDADPTAHAAAVADLDRYLGEFAYRPSAAGGDCTDLPMELSRQDVLDAGAQVVMVGNCGPAGWSQWVFERGDRWNESGYDGDYPAFPVCVGSRRVEQDYDAAFVRHWEDLTFVSAVAEGAIHHLHPATVRDMVRCGVDMIGFDRLTPFDGRLEALVWSWAPDEPAADLTRSCAYRGEDGRFHTDTDCSTPRPVACRVGDGWAVAPAAAWSDGDRACAAVGGEFSVPPTGWENERLGEIVAAAEVWLALGAAEPEPEPVPVPASPEGPTGTSLPATGATAPWWTVATALALAAAVRIGTRHDRGVGRRHR